MNAKQLRDRGVNSLVALFTKGKPEPLTKREVFNELGFLLFRLKMLNGGCAKEMWAWPAELVDAFQDAGVKFDDTERYAGEWTQDASR